MRVLTRMKSMIKTNVAQSVIHGLGLGADFAEIYVERNLSNLISTLSDRVQSVESGLILASTR